VQAFDPEPGGATSGALTLGPAPWSQRELRRGLARLHLGQRWLSRCWGARAGAWLARGYGLTFAVLAAYTARPFPELSRAVLRLSLVTLSWCAGLAALSLAGPGPERHLEEARGLLATRGVPAARLRAERPLMFVLWTIEKLAVIALCVVLAYVLATTDLRHTVRSFGLAIGALAYMTALGLGLGIVAWGCERLGGARGRALFIAVVLLPELVSPAWPELPTIVSSYGHLLDVCLRLGPRS
jgi:hypothetical protein